MGLFDIFSGSGGSHGRHYSHHRHGGGVMSDIGNIFSPITETISNIVSPVTHGVGSILSPITGGFGESIGQIFGQREMHGFPVVGPILTGVSEGLGNIPLAGRVLGPLTGLLANGVNGFGNWVGDLFTGGSYSAPSYPDPTSLPSTSFNAPRPENIRQGDYAQLGDLPPQNLPNNGRSGGLNIGG